MTIDTTPDEDSVDGEATAEVIVPTVPVTREQAHEVVCTWAAIVDRLDETEEQ